jgi:metal-responsive CopG/Arc/MetJ family transcriptional regulator
MRLHITLEDELVRSLDRRVGRRRRSAFISETVRRALEDAHRWEQIEAGLGSLAKEPHDWDEDGASWVENQRGSDPARLG